MRPFVGILEKSYSYCKCRYCKRKKHIRKKVFPNTTIRQKLKKLMKKEVENDVLD